MKVHAILDMYEVVLKIWIPLFGWARKPSERNSRIISNIDHKAQRTYGRLQVLKNMVSTAVPRGYKTNMGTAA